MQVGIVQRWALVALISRALLVKGAEASQLGASFHVVVGVEDGDSAVSLSHRVLAVQVVDLDPQAVIHLGIGHSFQRAEAHAPHVLGHLRSLGARHRPNERLGDHRLEHPFILNEALKPDGRCRE